mgnify:CR=1 FL=1
MFGELPAHFHVGEVRFAHEHQSGCAHVEAGYDYPDVPRAVGGDVHSPVKQTAEHRRTVNRRKREQPHPLACRPL